MTKNSPAYVTEATFKRETNELHHKIDTSVNRLAFEIVKTQEELADVKERMATKDDMNRLFNLMDGFAKNTKIVLDNQEVHLGYIRDHEFRLSALEKRPIN